LNIFGSDGFRCEFGSSFMTFDFIKKFSEGLANIYHEEGYSDPIIIGRDSRASGLLIEDLITTILLAKGINVTLANVIPTPGLSNLLNDGSYSIGIMITASHNPHQDNGIKLFKSSGFKLSSEIEEKIEKFILNNTNKEDIFNKRNLIGKKKSIDESFNKYISSILRPISSKILNKKVLIDCSNGAFSNLSKSFQDRKDLHFINIDPDGNNINLNCGALHAEDLHHIIKRDGYDFGIAFDGDGDRAVFVSKGYGVIEVEKLVLLFFKLLNRGTNNKVVISKISNLALKHNLHEINAELIETEVGDRFIVDAVKENHALFGCEPSGHFYFPNISKSMDGFVAMQNFLLLLDFYNGNIEHDLKSIRHYDRIQQNINISDYPMFDLEEVKKNIEHLIDKKKEKLIIRQSMWDPVIRVYYDYSQENNFLAIKNSIIKLLSLQKDPHTS
tara:strand:- start:5702 stop:7033 length:1332 start_codon:yes stop_codon:yes gene_type:complete